MSFYNLTTVIATLLIVAAIPVFTSVKVVGKLSSIAQQLGKTLISAVKLKLATSVVLSLVCVASAPAYAVPLEYNCSVMLPAVAVVFAASALTVIR